MVIFNDYELTDALFDLPCIIGNAKIYPTKVCEYKTFQKYNKYILYSKKHFNLPDNYEDSLLKCLIFCNIALLQNNKNFKMEDMSQADIIFRELEEFFSLICREELKFNFINNTYSFVNKDGVIIIDENNFDTVRLVLLKLNMAFEPKIYVSEIERKWEEKAMIARSKKSKKFDFADIITIVSCNTQKSYKDISEENTIQLYSDYFRCINGENSRATTLFQSVDSSYKGVDFTDSIVDHLFHNPYEGIWKDKSSLLGKL